MTTAGITTRMYCPLPRCTWFHDDPGPDPIRPPAGAVLTTTAGTVPTLDDYLSAIFAAHMAETESVVRTHVETHELIEWVRAVVELGGEHPPPAHRFPTDAPTSRLTPWPTPEIFGAKVLRQFRVSGYEPALLRFEHIGTCGFSALGPARRLDLIASTATTHVGLCDGTGPYAYVRDPDPWAAP